jgi:tetratricopeptide (TPR) repeat protein
VVLNLKRVWNFSDPAGSEKAFRDLLATHQEDRDLYCEIQTQIARAQGLQRNPDLARQTLHEVKEMLDHATPKGRIRYLLELGRVENSFGDKQCARLHFLDAYKLACEAKADFLAVDAAHMMGIVEPGEASLEWNERAIVMAEQTDDPDARDWAGSLYNNTGWTYHSMGKFVSALDMFERALAFRRTKGDQESIRIAEWCVARCLRSLGRTSEALAMQRELERIHSDLGNKPGFVFEELGECLLESGKPEEARPYFAKAHEELSKDQWLVAGEPKRLERLAALSATPNA